MFDNKDSRKLWFEAKQSICDLFQAEQILKSDLRHEYSQQKWRRNLKSGFIIAAVFLLLALGYCVELAKGSTIHLGAERIVLYAAIGLIIVAISIFGFGFYSYSRNVTVGLQRAFLHFMLVIAGLVLISLACLEIRNYGIPLSYILYCSIIGVFILLNWKEALLYFVPSTMVVVFYSVNFMPKTPQTATVIGALFWLALIFAIVSQRLFLSDLRAFRELFQRQQANQRLTEVNEQLERLSETDSLTGLLNRRALERYASQLWNHCLRRKEYITVAILDIDFFKPYNDKFGHPQGDICLKHVAQRLQQELRRPFDILARYGGEEFLVVLGFTGPEQGKLLTERLRAGVAELLIPTANTEISPFVTISIGGVSLRASGAYSIDALYRMADEQLYRAKGSGRNRVCLVDVDEADDPDDLFTTEHGIDSSGDAGETLSYMET